MNTRAARRELIIDARNGHQQFDAGVRSRDHRVGDNYWMDDEGGDPLVVCSRRRTASRVGQPVGRRTERDQLQQRPRLAFAIQDVGLSQVERRQWRRCGSLRVERRRDTEPRDT